VNEIGDAPVSDAQLEFAKLIERSAHTDGIHPTALPRVSLIRASQASEPIHVLHEPAICIIAQGRKQVMSGGNVFVYDRAQYLVVSVDVPIVGQIIEASKDRPYLCFLLSLDVGILGALMMEANLPAPRPGEPQASVFLSDVTSELLDAAVRLVRLLDSPRDIPILAPVAEREILYRLLIGPQGARLRQIAVADSRLQQVGRAISWLKRNFREPFRIEDLAREARMSPSALHQHFKTVTSMSPLQYQKQLRLQEARRLILAQAMDAALAGHSVGYDSPSQFSREYRRLFGAPPIRDVQRLRASEAPLYA
jgi:AraC-like DNA-binding protein